MGELPSEIAAKRYAGEIRSADRPVSRSRGGKIDGLICQDPDKIEVRGVLESGA
jgi:hypothetical protein